MTMWVSLQEPAREAVDSTAGPSPVTSNVAGLWSDLASIPLNDWIVAIGAAVGAGLLFSLALRVVLRRSRSLAARSDTDLDDLMVELASRTRGLFVALVAIWVGARFVDLPEGPATLLRSLLYIGVFVQGGLWANGIVNHLFVRYRKRQLEEDPTAATALGAIGFLSRTAVWAIVVLLIIDNLGFDVTALVTGLGIGGIAVALAVQNVLGDLFASLAIVLDKPFVVGDFIVVGDLSGTVEHVGVKTTRVRSISGEQIVFGNSQLLGDSIRNYGRLQERRVVFGVGVEYGTPMEMLRRIPDMIRQAVEAQEHARFDRSHLKAFGDSAIEFETVYYVPVPEYSVYMDVQQGINLGLVEAFESNDIAFAFPSRTLYVRREAGDGDVLETDAAAG